MSDLKSKVHKFNDLKEHNINAYGGLLAGPDINLNPYAFVLRLLKTASEKYKLHIAEGVKFIEARKEKMIMLSHALNTTDVGEAVGHAAVLKQELP